MELFTGLHDIRHNDINCNMLLEISKGTLTGCYNRVVRAKSGIFYYGEIIKGELLPPILTQALIEEYGLFVLPDEKTQKSITTIKNCATVMLETATLEKKRSSDARKKTLEKMYASLSLHCSKIQVPCEKLSVWYDPKQYKRIAEQVLQEVKNHYEQ